MTSTAPATLLESIDHALLAAQRSGDGVATPAAVLWPDPDGQWQPLLPMLQKTLPALYALGPYQPERRIGPVIWLRCIVGRALPEPLAEGVVPIFYLPHVSRQALRAGTECPRELQPLIELQYRGATWHQRNGREWTVEAFLVSEEGCGLEVAADSRTRESMLRALPLVAVEPLVALRGRRLEADDFDRMAIGDPIRDLLAWMSDPPGFEAACDAARWRTFCDVCRREFGIDPDQAGPQAAGDALLNGVRDFGNQWDQAWLRFTEAPALYAGIPSLLRSAQPQGLLVNHERQPKENEAAEAQLREALASVGDASHADACKKVLALEASHGKRRAWVWARLGDSPLAMALEPLARLAGSAQGAVDGVTAEAMASAYAENGWRCDRAALEALASPRSVPDTALIGRAVRALYEPWLDRGARRFQELIAAAAGRNLVTAVVAERDCCVLFVDGLRFDVGMMLHERLEARGLSSKLGHRLSPLPTVTNTAKPIASPAHALVEAGSPTDEFNPCLRSDGKPLNAPRLRQAMVSQGVEVLPEDDDRFAGSGDAGGWSEIGKLDELGHKMDARVVSQVDTEVETIVARINALLNAGWQKVRVVTDHGWLLLPGGLPKVEVPRYLVESRWARCASVSGNSAVDLPTFPWYWNPTVRIATPPGIGSFYAGKEYAHGGVSLQECVVPDLVVQRGQAATEAKLVEIVWRGMRCKVKVASTVPTVRVDLRKNWKQPESSIAVASKQIDESGEASLVCADDRQEGAAAMVVLMDDNGRVLDYRPTTVGEAA